MVTCLCLSVSSIHPPSAIGTCQYCDYSCPMGGCCDVRCFNSPHNWQLGWGTPLTTLSTATFPVGSFITISMPNQQVGDFYTDLRPVHVHQKLGLLSLQCWSSNQWMFSCFDDVS